MLKLFERIDGTQGDAAIADPFKDKYSIEYSSTQFN